jgi:hypothetical protein
MKKHLLTTVILSLLFLGAFAQEFQSVNSGREAYFSFAGYDFSFLKIDSSKVYNGDSVVYPSRSLERVDYRCYSRFAPSWAGSKIIVQNDGTNIYFNHNNDSIVIKTKAALNEKWTAYKIAGSISIIAEVIECKYDLVLGLEDSVKTIHFQVLDSAENPIDDPVNQMQLMLSRHYGWTKALNFNLFPNLEADYFPYQYFQSCELIGISNPKAGRQNLTWSDVHDFDPGDVLHVYETNYNCCGTSTCKKLHRRTIYNYLDRADYPDSIVCLVKRETHEMITQYPDTVSVKVFYDTISQLIKPYPKFDILSGELIPNDDEYRLRLVNQYTNLGLEYKSFSDTFNNYENDSCWSMLIVDGGGPYEYIKGLGGGYYDYEAVCSRSLRELQYYKKGNNEWGTPFNFTGLETLHAQKEVKVYPNPASETVYVETIGQATPITFDLYSADGNRVVTKDLPGGNQQIDVRCLTPGLYYYTITVENLQQSSGKVIITH